LVQHPLLFHAGVFHFKVQQHAGGTAAARGLVNGANAYFAATADAAAPYQRAIRLLLSRLVR